jgi:PBP1b-binding outer membrane lipoprotein LpoB
MRSIGTVLAATILAVGLAACGGAPAPDAAQQKKDDEKARALGRDTDKTVFDDMIRTEDKARNVENITLGHKADLDKAMEQAEGNGAPATDQPPAQ